MRQFTSFLHSVSILLFSIILSFFYAVLVDINPFLPLNIILWLGFCFLMYKAIDTQKWHLQPLRYLSLTLHAILIIYIIYGVKSCYFISYYNELYLTGQVGVFPSGYTDALIPTLIDLSIYIEKLEFMLGWNEISISFGSNRIVHFGSFLSNAIRLFEILGIFVTPYVFTRFFSERLNS